MFTNILSGILRGREGSSFKWTSVKQQAVGGSASLEDFFFVGGARLSHWKHQEISLQKAPLCFLSLESLWKPRTGGFKQGVCLWKHRSAIHFQLSWVQSTHLWWVGSPHLISSSMLQQILPAVPLAAITLSTLQIWPVCFLIMSEYLAQRWGTGFNSDSTLTSLLPQDKIFCTPCTSWWILLSSTL